jgi:hypothetical protein
MRQKLTTEQKKMNREFARLTGIINSATRGQQMIRPNAGGYTNDQQATWDKYQGFIERAAAKIADLERAANLR